MDYIIKIKFQTTVRMTQEIQNSIISSDLSLIDEEKLKTKKSQATDSYLKKWTVPENILYARYLKTHMGQMSNKKKKKCGKFVKMANFIGSKTENQCRSHHQKMLLTFKSIQNIIRYVAEMKTKGELIPLEEYQIKIDIDMQEPVESKGQIKIEEQISTQRQSQQEIKQGKKDENELTEFMWNGLPIHEEESKMVCFDVEDDGIFDVLNMEAVDKYSQFFNC